MIDANEGFEDPFENSEDEAEILTNQDETDPGGTSRDDRFMGAGPTELSGEQDPDDFVLGEVDVKEQMDRAIRARQHTDHTLVDSDLEPLESSDINESEILADSLSNRHGSKESSEAEKVPHHGGATGAYTDLGAGRSGVTRQY